MNDKINKRIILIGMICTIIPLEISTSSIIKYILSYIPMLIGYMLYFEEYNKYTDKQKKLFKTAVYISIVHIFAGMWDEFILNTPTSTLSIGFDELIACSIFYISYFIHRIFSLLLCINILKDKWRKTKIFISIGILIVGLMFLSLVCNPHNCAKLKGQKTFGYDYCKGVHYKGEFVREIPWKCELCGYSTDVINPDENIPIICFSCSLSTDRCMECGLLEKDN